MPSHLLAKAQSQGRTIVEVTPQRAHWNYVGFRAIRLANLETEDLHTQTREFCIVILVGRVDISVTSASGTTLNWHNLGSRAHVFDEAAPAAVYIPAEHKISIKALGDAEVALCSAPCDQAPRVAQLLDSAAMTKSVRGKGHNTRYICDVLPHHNPIAAHLLVVEVRTPASHSSSYPPHKHDTETEGVETVLEETYYHRLNPSQGFVFQRVYTDDRSIDEACAAEDHDVVMVPRGYHPVVVPHGYESYYLNVMAGPKRLWVFRNDPAHAWLLQP